jgi:hypothetical protein
MASASASVIAGCAGTEITGEGARVATATSPPVDSGWDPASCRDLGVVVGAASNGLYTDEHLVAFALNDLRNKAAELGANYVQYSAPSVSHGVGTAAWAAGSTVTGTAYACTRKRALETASATTSPAACIKGSTQPCVGPGACKGGQSCLDDGSGFSACDCGTRP